MSKIGPGGVNVLRIDSNIVSCAVEMDPLQYFCVVYFHETYSFMRFIEQKYVWYYDIITY